LLFVVNTGLRSRKLQSQLDRKNLDIGRSGCFPGCSVDSEERLGLDRRGH
jgi:hypothetical protein